MSKNIIQSIVVILGMFIIIAFLALIYGMYLKISTPDKQLSKLPIYFSALLEDEEKIKNIEVINKEKILILIESKDNMRGLIYEINNNQVIREINR